MDVNDNEKVTANDIGGIEHAAIWYLRRSVRNVADAMHWLRMISNFCDFDTGCGVELQELDRLLPDWDLFDGDRTEDLLTHICETIHLYVDLNCKDEHAAQIQAFSGGLYFVQNKFLRLRKILYQAVSTGAVAPSTVPIHELS